METPVYERSELAPGAEITGPALIEEPGATAVLFPGHGLEVDPLGNLRVRVTPCGGAEVGT